MTVEDRGASATPPANPDPAADPPPVEAADHRARMQRKQAARARLAAERTAERGLVIVHTGPGKGKTTAALGMVLRCLGHGFPVTVVQFVKGSRETAERTALARAYPDLVTFSALGEGFSWETQDRERDRALAARSWAVARAALADPRQRMVVLDEIAIALRDGTLAVGDLLEALAARPAAQHVVATGRGAPEALIAAADLVTEMRLVKHPFRAGIKGQPGVEF